jgi:replicative DNA helicase
MAQRDRVELERSIVYSAVTYPADWARFEHLFPAEHFASPLERKAVEALHYLSANGIEIEWENLQNQMAQDYFVLDVPACDLGIAARTLGEINLTERKNLLMKELGKQSSPFDSLDSINRALNDFSATLSAYSTKSKTTILQEYVEGLEKARDGKILRVPTGVPTLDKWTHGGLRLGDLSFLGGAPGTGKTSFMLTVAQRAAASGYKTVMLEGEMPMEQILSRAHAQYSNVPVWQIERGMHLHLFKDFHDYLTHIDLVLSSSYERNVEALLSQVRRQVKAGAQLILIDYLQVFVDKTGKAQDEFSKIKHLSEQLRKITLLNNVHVMAASSLNRLDHGAAKITLNSFYGGAQLGHDCAVAIILSEGEPSADINRRALTVDVVKNRAGMVGEFTVTYDLETQRMAEMATAAIVGSPAGYNPAPDDEDPF